MKILRKPVLFAAVALLGALSACGSCKREEESAPAPAPEPVEDGGRTRFFRPEPDFGRRDGGFRIPRHRHREAGADAAAVAPSSPIE